MAAPSRRPGVRMSDDSQAALPVAQQAFLEISVAQSRGPGWYTNGESGMYKQVRRWVDKGSEAIRLALSGEK